MAHPHDRSGKDSDQASERPIDISPDKLKADAEAVQEIMARHLTTDADCEIVGTGPASYGIARYIAKRIAAQSSGAGHLCDAETGRACSICGKL